METVKLKRGKVEKCSQCGSGKLIYDFNTGETICAKCGLVLSNSMVFQGPEWRAFTQEEKQLKSRAGSPMSYSVFDKGLSTTIGRIDRDALGRKVPQSSRPLMWRLRRWQIRSRVHSSAERNLARAMNELDRLSDKLSTGESIKENAAYIYRKALEKDLVKGRSIAAVAAAALYAACRNGNKPRTLKEISEASMISVKDVARCYRLIVRELELQMPIDSPVAFVSKIGEKAGVSEQTQGLAIKILREARKNRVDSGKYPAGLAAAALYIACLQSNEKKTQKDIADAADVTEVTVRNRYKALERQLALRLPD